MQPSSFQSQEEIFSGRDTTQEESLRSEIIFMKGRLQKARRRGIHNISIEKKQELKPPTVPVVPTIKIERPAKEFSKVNISQSLK